MRKLALDVGDVRIGFATSDIMGIIASGYETYTRKGAPKDYEYIAEFCKNNQVDTIVIGLPVNMDGTEGDRVTITRQFAEELKECAEAAAILDNRMEQIQAKITNKKQ